MSVEPGQGGASFTVVGYGSTLDWPPPRVPGDGPRRFRETKYLALTKTWLHTARISLPEAAAQATATPADPRFGLTPTEASFW